MIFIGALITNTESMCKVKSYEVKAVFQLGILFRIFIEGLRVKHKTSTLFLLHLDTESS